MSASRKASFCSVWSTSGAERLMWRGISTPKSDLRKDWMLEWPKLDSLSLLIMSSMALKSSLLGSPRKSQHVLCNSERLIVHSK